VSLLLRTLSLHTTAAAAAAPLSPAAAAAVTEDLFEEDRSLELSLSMEESNQQESNQFFTDVEGVQAVEEVYSCHYCNCITVTVCMKQLCE
jgi:ABC-type sugar transport system substrate-binding protein